MYERAWIIGYALTYQHDPRPLIMANAGFNRLEINRDGPVIPRMARFFASHDAAWDATKHLAPWARARAMCRAEARSMGYDRKQLNRLLAWLTRLERFERALGIVRKRPVTHQTLDRLGRWLEASRKRKGAR